MNEKYMRYEYEYKDPVIKENDYAHYLDEEEEE